MTHERAAELIHAKYDGVLDDRARAELEAHLEECEACNELSATYGVIYDALREEVEHLAADEVVAYAADPGSLVPYERQRIEAHAAECVSCRGEISRMERLHASVSADPTGHGSSVIETRWWSRPSSWLAAAAAILIAALLYPAFLGVYRLPAVASRADALGAESARLRSEVEGLRDSAARSRRELDRLRDWSGALGLELITSSLRATGEARSITIDRGRPFVLLGVQVAVTADVPDEVPVRFELLGAAGDPVAFMRLTAREAREAVRTVGMVTWLVPIEGLEPGDYTIRVVREDVSTGPELLQVPVELRLAGPPTE